MSEANDDVHQAAEDGEPTITDEISTLLTKVRSRSRRFSRVKNLLRKVDGKSPDVADYERWLEVYRGLEGYELGLDEIEETEQRRARLVDRLAKGLTKLRVKARMKFMTKVEMLAKEADLEVEKVSESPLVLYVEPVTFRIDFEQGGIESLYGHESIGECRIDAADLFEERRRAVDEMQRQALASEVFFDLLYDAYRTVLVADGAEPGDRIDLVDVLVPLAMLRVDSKKLRKKGPEAIESFPRYLLARQLATMRRDGLLEKNGKRLDLGAATGGSTRDKTNVLYVPVRGATSGQYYGSLRFETVR